MQRHVWVLAALVLLSVGCGDGGGPGSFHGRLSSSTVAPGGAVVQVNGVGIVGIRGSGATVAFSAQTAGTEEGDQTFRVVLVSPVPGDLDFSIEVADRSAARPVAVVLSAVDGENQPITPLTSFSTEVFR